MSIAGTAVCVLCNKAYTAYAYDPIPYICTVCEEDLKHCEQLEQFEDLAGIDKVNTLYIKGERIEVKHRGRH